MNLLKIDCEGAEFPILLTSTRLAAIDRIVGEYHELRADLPPHVRLPGCNQFTVDMLTAQLERHGFGVTIEQQATRTSARSVCFSPSARRLADRERRPMLVCRQGKAARPPCAVAALVADALVQPVRIARPELDRIGHDAVASPERRALHGTALKTIGGVADAAVERGRDSSRAL